MDGTGIYQLSGRGVKSVADYDMEAANLDAAKQQKELRAMQILTGQQGLQEKQRQLERAGALRQLAGTWKADTTDDQRIATLRNAGFADEADKLLEGSLKRKDVESQAAQRMSEADKNRLGLFTTKLEQNHKMWEGVTNPQEAHALVDATFADPEMAAVAKARGQTPELAHKSINDASATPEAFQNFLVTRSKGMGDLIKYLRPDANTVANNQTSIATNAATNARVAAEGAANRAQQERQHAASRADAAQAVTYQTDPDTGLTVALPSRLAPGAPVEARNVTVGGVPLKGKTAADKPLAPAVVKSLTEARDNATTIDNLATSFKPEYAGKGVLGMGADAQLAAAGTLGRDKDSVEWWKNYRKQAELVERHALFGAALTPGEQASWRSADIGPGMDPGVIAQNLATRKALAAKVADNARQDAIDAGHNETRVNKIATRSGSAFASEAEAEAAAAAGKIKKGDKITVNGQSGVWQ